MTGAGSSTFVRISGRGGSGTETTEGGASGAVSTERRDSGREGSSFKKGASELPPAVSPGGGPESLVVSPFCAMAGAAINATASKTTSTINFLTMLLLLLGLDEAK
jgi:hypothetical protein